MARRKEKELIVYKLYEDEEDAVKASEELKSKDIENHIQYFATPEMLYLAVMVYK